MRRGVHTVRECLQITHPDVWRHIRLYTLLYTPLVIIKHLNKSPLVKEQ